MIVDRANKVLIPATPELINLVPSGWDCSELRERSDKHLLERTIITTSEPPPPVKYDTNYQHISTLGNPRFCSVQTLLDQLRNLGISFLLRRL